MKCGIKQTKPKDKTKWITVEVHHKKGIPNWEAIFEVLYKYLLIHPDEMETLCKACHNENVLSEDLDKLFT